jgi:hypothetical protein
MKIVAIALAAGFLSSAFASGSKVIEEQARLGEGRRRQGREVAQDIVVAVSLDDTAPQPYPLLVLNHGRSWDPGRHRCPSRREPRSRRIAGWLWPFGDDGHGLSGAPQTWQPKVLEFLRANGYPGAVTVGARIEHWTFTPRLTPSRS